MFTVIELQTINGVTSSIVTNHSSENEAYQKYHQILSFAAVSEVDIHSACVLNEYGNVLKNEFYIHKEESEEIPEV